MDKDVETTTGNDKKINIGSPKGKKKMTEAEKEEYESLRYYLNNKFEDFTENRKKGWKSAATPEEVDERLVNKEMLNFTPNSKNLQYENRPVTEKGYVYFCKLRDLRNALREKNWSFYSMWIGVVNIVILLIILAKTQGWR